METITKNKYWCFVRQLTDVKSYVGERNLRSDGLCVFAVFCLQSVCFVILCNFAASDDSHNYELNLKLLGTYLVGKTSAILGLVMFRDIQFSRTPDADCD